MIFGTLKHWNKNGFGFIQRDDHTSDVFVHASEMQRAGIKAVIGTRLEFDTETNGARIRAIDIKLVA